MLQLSLLLPLLFIFPHSISTTAISKTTIPSPCLSPSYLRATALTTNPSTNTSIFQCWQFASPFNSSSVPGIAGSLALNLDISKELTYTVIPPNFDGGLHNAPVLQYVFFISGLAHIALPGSNEEIYVLGGENGLIIANDTTGKGHITRYPSKEITVALTVPFEFEGGEEGFEIVNEGVCGGDNQIVCE